MVYVTWKYNGENEVNVESFSTIKEAKEFIKDNKLSDVADIVEMGW